MISTVVGARPQLVKCSAVSRELRRQGITESLIHTGQHFDPDMSDIFFSELEIPDCHTNLGVSGGSHAQMTAQMLILLEAEFLRLKPSLVLLYGDTNSTLAGAIAAAKLGLPIAHVEAGPRTWNRSHPEEVNRVLVDHMSELLFCSTDRSRQNLAREGITAGVHCVGDVLLDALLWITDRLPAADVGLRPYVLATIHRAQNTDDANRLRQILDGLAMCPYPVLLPLHPRTRAALQRHGLSLPSNIQSCRPLPYSQMITKIRDCRYVVTDSGGTPKEAFFLGRRSITVATETPWPELLECGGTVVADCDPVQIMKAFSWADAPPPASGLNVFGNGTAAKHMTKLLVRHLS